MKNIDDNKHADPLTITTYIHQLKNDTQPLKMTSYFHNGAYFFKNILVKLF